MADDSPTPPRADVRAGGTLDFSTGPGAPPPEPPAPRPPVTPDPEVRAGRTLDLSVKPPGTTSRKPPIQDFGGGLVMREKVDLSTKRPEPSAEAAPEQTKPQPRRDAPRGGGGRDASRRQGGRDSGRGRDSRDTGRGRSKGEAPASASSSLADLLDPEMLAKLRGG